jgi:hypothetical protein
LPHPLTGVNEINDLKNMVRRTKKFFVAHFLLGENSPPPVKKTKANFLKNANLFGNPDFGAIGSTSSPYHGMGSGSFSVK